MRRLFGLLSLLALFFLAGCDTSNPMLAPLPVHTGRVISPVVTSPASKPTPTPKPIGYTLQDVQKHKTANDCWTVIAGKIYNMSSFSSRHSGGANPILAVCGKDGTSIYAQQHGSNTSLIQSFFVADLQ